MALPDHPPRVQPTKHMQAHSLSFAHISAHMGPWAGTHMAFVCVSAHTYTTPVDGHNISNLPVGGVGTQSHTHTHKLRQE